MRYSEIAPRRLNETATHFRDIAAKPGVYVHEIIDTMIEMGENAALDDYPNEEDVEQQLAASAAHFARFVQEGQMCIYRAITPSEVHDPHRHGLGIYWTCDMGRAYPHWGDRRNYIVVTALVSEEDINVWQTLAMDFTGLTEEEIRLNPTAQVTVTAVHDKDDDPIASDWIGKTFSAKAS